MEALASLFAASLMIIACYALVNMPALMIGTLILIMFWRALA